MAARSCIQELSVEPGDSLDKEEMTLKITNQNGEAMPKSGSRPR